MQTNLTTTTEAPPQPTQKPASFSLGSIVATPGALEAIASKAVSQTQTIRKTCSQ